MSKEISALKGTVGEKSAELARKEQKYTDHWTYCAQVEKSLNRATLENEKLRRQNKQLVASQKKAVGLFEHTLKIKLQYEEIIRQLEK